MGSTVRAAALSGYVELVRELGGEPAEFLSRFDIPAGIECQPDAFVNFNSYTNLLEVTADELRCPDFGLRLVPLRGLDFAGPVTVMARNSETVLDALQAAARFMYIHTPALKVTIDCVGSLIRVVYDLTEQIDRYPLHAMEASLGSTARFGYLLTDLDTRNSVSLTHPQRGSDAAYQNAYGCAVRFDQSWCGFEMTREQGAARVRDANPEIRRIVTKYLEANYLPPTSVLSDRVAEQARQLLPTGLCSVDTIADQLAMHPRTLQRRLASVGLRCQDIIDRERRTQAERYLAVTGLEFSHIAGLLGYTEQSALNRSCRRWFGKTPGECRAQHMNR
jgi:AraC-like DNA-binding protein